MTIDTIPGSEQPDSSPTHPPEQPMAGNLDERAEEPAPGEPLLEGRYRVLELLGQGGFAAVYRAWDLHLNRPCAIKENQVPSVVAQRQFEREASLLAGLHHPNLPRVTDHFLVPGRGQFLVMDYVEGEDLYQRLQRNRGPFDEAQVLEWILPICEALIYLHNQTPPVIHRDIKPQNIVLTAAGRIYLVDFGIAKVFTPNLSTTIGARAVSPGYSPPEQYGQSTTDARSDLYALGATLYTLLCGETPPDAIDMMSGVVAPPRPLRQANPRISPHVAEAVMRAMQPARTQRYASVAEFKAALFPPASQSLQALETEVVYPLTPAPDRKEPADRPSKPAAQKKPSNRIRGATRPGARSNQDQARPDQTAAWAVPLVGLIGVAGLIGILVVVWLILGSRGANSPIQAATPKKGGLAEAPALQPASTSPVVGMAGSTPEPTVTKPATAAPSPESTPIPTGVDRTANVLIPAGTFRMGVDDAELEWHVSLCNRYGPCDDVDYQDAMPAHLVSLDAFRLDAHEVTNEQYRACVAAGACQPVDTGVFTAPLPPNYATSPAYASYPVVGVRWEDAAGYCQWVGKSLPTEAQWERAASGDGTWVFPWGNPKSNNPLDPKSIFGNTVLANFCDQRCTYSWRDTETDDGWEGPAPVMSYKPNYMGLYDLSGNVQEWVQDYYSADFYARSPEDNPVNQTPGACPGRFETDCHLTRGGGWNNGLYHSTSRFRHFAYAGNIKPYRGFRCAATP